MHAIKLDVFIDEPIAQTLPGLRSLVGKRVELIALETPRPAEPVSHDKTNFDDLVPYKPPPGVGPVSLEEIERAIVEGAIKRARV